MAKPKPFAFCNGCFSKKPSEVAITPNSKHSTNAFTVIIGANAVDVKYAKQPTMANRKNLK